VTEKAPPFFTPWRPLLAGWGLSALGWGVLYVVMGLQIAQTLPLSLAGAVRFIGPNWLVWTLLTPLIFRAVTRWPIERGRWLAALGHLAVCVAVVLAFEGFKELMGPPQFIGTKHGEIPPHPRPDLLARILGGPNIPIYLALLGVAHALFFYRRAKEEELWSVELSASLAEARLQALRMQLHPHFLFNSLNAVAELMHEDLERADEMLCALSEFLRMTLMSDNQQQVPLAREFEFAERYLAIEKVRFGERLSYSVDVPAGLKDVLVPSLILQPIVENAVRHGVEPKLGAGAIVVRAQADREFLRLTVHDDGGGMADAPALGVGLSNTRARLRELYGDEASFQVMGGPGTVIEIKIPLPKRP
jgi:signal transduction histidine kinase